MIYTDLHRSTSNYIALAAGEFVLLFKMFLILGAFNTTIAAAAAQGKGVWIPQGTFAVKTRFTLNKLTVRGAGPWYVGTQ